MANIGTVLKVEIIRLARREVRREVQLLRKSSAGYRREIAALKRAIATLERCTKALAKSTPMQSSSTLTDETPIRFVAKGLVSLRKRLGLSAAELAQLLGVSMQSVYNWEHKKASPRKEQVAAIVALRPIGKNEARRRLEAMTRSLKRQVTPAASGERKRLAQRPKKRVRAK
jgi:DNA-binding transcriptional regulator YiaG